MSRLASASERTTCDIGHLSARTRYTTWRPGCNLCRPRGHLECGNETALLVAEDSKRWRMSMQRQTSAKNTAKHVSHRAEITHQYCNHFICTAASCDNYLDEHVSCTGYLQGFTTPRAHSTSPALPPHKPNIHHSNALSLLLDCHHHTQAPTNFIPVSSLPRPTRSRVVPSSRLVCTYIYKATECELAPLMSQISNVHPATLS